VKIARLILQVALFLAGLFLFCYIVSLVDARQLLQVLLSLKVNIVFIAALYLFINFWYVWGWQVIFQDADRPKVKFWPLFNIRLAGDAINNVTPFIDVGGEPLKVALAASAFSLSKRSVFATIIVERTALLVSEMIFWVLGLVPLLLYWPLPADLKNALLIVTVIFSLISSVLVLGQSRGWIGKWFGKFSLKVKDVDLDIKSFYRHPDRRWFFTLFLHTVGWLAGVLEMFVILYALGTPVSLFEALIAESMLQLIRSASFFIPGNLGAQEAGLAFILQGLGHTSSVGIAVSLIKRFRQLVWTGIGLLIGYFYGKPKL